MSEETKIETTETVATAEATESTDSTQDTSNKFKPITTQEEFNNRLKGRLEQQERVLREKFIKENNYVSRDELNKINEEHKKEIASLKSENSALKIAQFKNKLLSDYSLPHDLIDNLVGTTEEELEESAKKLASVFSRRQVAPQAQAEKPIDMRNSSEQMLLNLSKKLR